ncbi:MAG: GIY-YIG nuclease family protein [Solirubrobacteraceae bacterium]
MPQRPCGQVFMDNWDPVACWACGQQRHPHVHCDHCRAPSWRAETPPSGVYILFDRATALVKIGVSEQLRRRLNDYPKRMVLARAMWGATPWVERWLHDVFDDWRVPEEAKAEGLPFHTEWFRMNDAIAQLAYGEPFIGPPHFEPLPLPWPL